MKNKVIIFAIVLSVAWFLGVLRFDYHWASVLFKGLLFPFAWLYTVCESYCNLHFPNSWFSNEWTQIFVFLLSVFLQSYLYYFLLKSIRKRFSK